MSKDKIKSHDSDSVLIILPSCYGNFKSISTFCRDCRLKDKCKEIPPPKEPGWCNSP
ncbi:MAG: hypothetical protein ACFFA0_14290 [Promethearchaeota archaeon]